MSLIDEIDLLNGPIGYRSPEERCRTLLQMSRECVAKALPAPTWGPDPFEKMAKLADEVEALGWAAFRLEKEFPERAASFKQLAKDKENEMIEMIKKNNEMRKL